MDLLTKPVWILLCIYLVFQQTISTSGQNVTLSALEPGDGGLVEEPIIEPENVRPLGGDGPPVEEPIIVPEHVEPLDGGGAPVEEPIIVPEHVEPLDGGGPPVEEQPVVEEPIVPEHVEPLGDGGVQPVEPEPTVSELERMLENAMVSKTDLGGEDSGAEAEPVATQPAVEPAAVTESAPEPNIEEVTEARADVIIISSDVTEETEVAMETTADAPVDCSLRPACRMYCEHGFMKGPDDCDICQCVESTGPPHEPEEVVVIEPTTQQVEIMTTQVSEDMTTESDDVITTQLPHVETTEEKSDDPCHNYESLGESWRHVTKGGGNHDDKDMEHGWYAFKHGDDWAVIPTLPIKENHCGSQYPYRLNLKDQELPEFNVTIEAELCTSADVGGTYVTCVLNIPVQVKGCEGYYIYNITGLRGRGAICMQAPGEDIPYSAWVNAPATTAQTSVSQPPSTPEPLPIKSIEVAELTEKQQAGLVTVDYSYPYATLDREFFIQFEKDFRERLIKTLAELSEPTTASAPAETDAATDVVMDVRVPADTAHTEGAAGAEPEPEVTAEPIADDVTEASDGSANSINDQPGAGTAVSNEAAGLESAEGVVTESDGSVIPADAPEPLVRRRRQADQELTADDVTHVGPTPRLQDDKLQMSFFIEDKDGNVIPAADVLRAINAMEASTDDPDVAKVNAYEGFAKDGAPVVASRESIWDAHRGLWITLAVMFAICLLIVMFCLICLTCCRKEEYTPNEKSPLREAEEGSRHPMVMENPITDDIMKRDEAPMVECANPAFTTNGGGHHLAKDEDNGYIVPLHELSDDERRKLDVENTKL